MTELTIAPAFPEPYLQPDRHKDCGYYAAAYVARCLGQPDVTAEQVKAWRAETSRHESYYSRYQLGAEMVTMWDASGGSGDSVPEFWLGPKARDWARRWLDDGWIAQACVHRIAEMGHAAVALSCDDSGVLLMDPIYGHVTEPWEWFLGPGPKRDAAVWPGRAPDGREFYGCTYIEGWFRTQPSGEA